MIKSKKLLKSSSASAHEEMDEGTWALSYGDMITLLLSFFVIYFSTDPKREKMLQSNSLMTFMLEGKEAPAATEPKPMGTAWQKDLEKLDLHAQMVGEHVVVTFGGMSFFESGTTQVNGKALQALQAFSTKYLPYAGKYHLAIKGFTDKTPVTPKRGRNFVDNLELSALRSIASMRVLQKSGIPLNRMEIAGAGELDDISKVLPSTASLTTKEIDSLSRTIVLVLKPEKASF
jgi:flagellar motor protein MotB